MAEPLFPFTIYPAENGTPTWLRAAWLRVKPKGMTWYALGAEVLDHERVIIKVYLMANPVYGGVGNPVYGGVGDLVHAQEVKLTDDEYEGGDEYHRGLHKIIETRAYDLAERDLEREEQKARDARIKERRLALYGI